jgi:hypothetical protein
MRPAAALIAGIAAASLAAQLIASAQSFGAAAGTWLVLGFFTNLTGIALAATFTAAALGRPSPRWLAGFTLHSVMVGAVFQLLLRELYRPEGLAWWADLGLHVVLPLLAPLVWWRLMPKDGLRWRDAAIWLAWPLGFAAYALLRGAITGWYPYPFLDAGQLGAAALAANILALGAAFWALGLAMVWLARRRP